MLLGTFSKDIPLCVTVEDFTFRGQNRPNFQEKQSGFKLKHFDFKHSGQIFSKIFKFLAITLKIQAKPGKFQG